MTISMPPRRDPAVLPTGRKGTAGKTANTQKIAKAIEPRTTFTEEAKAIFAAQQEKICTSVGKEIQHFTINKRLGWFLGSLNLNS